MITSVTGSADVCLLYFIYLLEGEAGRKGSTCMLYFVAAVALYVRVRGPGANLNTVNSLDWHQTNLINIYSSSEEKKEYSNEPKNTLYFLF